MAGVARHAVFLPPANGSRAASHFSIVVARRATAARSHLHKHGSTSVHLLWSRCSSSSSPSPLPRMAADRDPGSQAPLDSISERSARKPQSTGHFYSRNSVPMRKDVSLFQRLLAVERVRMHPSSTRAAARLAQLTIQVLQLPASKEELQQQWITNEDIVDVLTILTSRDVSVAANVLRRPIHQVKNKSKPFSSNLYELVHCLRQMRDRQKLTDIQEEIYLGEGLDYEALWKHSRFTIASLYACVQQPKGFSKNALERANRLWQDLKKTDAEELSSQTTRLLLAIIESLPPLTEERDARRSRSKLVPCTMLRLDSNVLADIVKDPQTQSESDEGIKGVVAKAVQARKAFEHIWTLSRDFRGEGKVRSTAHGLALTMECRLAAWRMTHSDRANDLRAAWAPVQDVMRRLHSIGELVSEHLITVMYYAAALPVVGKPRKWHSLKQLQQVYRAFLPPILCRAAIPQMDLTLKDANAASQAIFGLALEEVCQFSATFSMHAMMVSEMVERGDWEAAILAFQCQQHAVNIRQYAGNLLPYPAMPSKHAQAQENAFRKRDWMQQTMTPLKSYVSLFRGISLHGLPHKPVLWTLETETGEIPESGPVSLEGSQFFEFVFERFLQVKSMKGRSPKASIPLDQVDPISLQAKSPPTENAFAKSAGPTSEDQRDILDALSTVSNNDADWALRQWRRVVAKFRGPVHRRQVDGQTTHVAPVQDVFGRTVSKEGWVGWSNNAEVERALKQLHDTAAEEDLASSQVEEKA